jgi:hypothetical protein
MRLQITILLSGLVLLTACQVKKPVNPEITVPELQEHIDYLASDELKGRYPGSKGSREAIRYMQNEFTRAGLSLKGEEGFQSFQVTTAQKTGPGNALSIRDQKYTPGSDFTPMPFSGNGKVSDSVIFVGYGLKAEREGFQWNDYAGQDIKGHWVMMLRGGPRDDGLRRQFMGRTKDREKALQAKDLGAAGVLFVSGPAYDPQDQLADPTLKKGNIEIPAIHIKRKIANLILGQQTIEDLEKKINQTGRSLVFPVSTPVTAASELLAVKADCRNVVAELRADGAGDTGRYIVVGGHFDHLGMGGEGTGSRRPDTTAVHNGADDNASGIAAMLEIAEKLVTQKDSLEHHFLFVAFDAEELGLVGSKHFLEYYPLLSDSIEAMINLDMIGRLRNENSLQIGGTGTAKESENLLKTLNGEANFSLGLSPEGYGPSDHSSFYFKDIPVFFFSTGPHLDYHTPADDPDQINYPGLKKISDFVYNLSMKISGLDSGLTFTEAGSSGRETGRNQREDLQVTLGIMPDFAGVEERGLRADMVISGKPADKAGMKNGDIIVAIDGREISDIYDYMDRLSEFQPGQTITVEVIREKEHQVLMVQL